MALVQQLPILHLSVQDFRSSSLIAISDESTYIATPLAGYYNMVITPPGYNPITVPFVPLSVNIFKCVDLGITCSDSDCTKLPDGIYDVTYTVIPNGSQVSDTNQVTVDYKFVKIDIIKCIYQKEFLSLHKLCDCHNIDYGRGPKQELRRAKLYIDGCVAECNRGNYVLSNDLYNKAMYILNHLGCNENHNRNSKSCNC